jgi:hypothetical protein
MEIMEQDIGGARIRRTFSMGELRAKPGDHLTATEVMKIPRANRTALVNAGYLEVYPKSLAPEPGDIFLVDAGKGKYNVIEGRQLNKKPLTLEEAEALSSR